MKQAPQIHTQTAAAIASNPDALGFFCWYEFNDNAIDKPSLDAALLSHGFDPAVWAVEPVSHHNVFSKVARNEKHKYRAAGESADRVIVFVPLDTTSDEAVYVAHVSRKEGKRKGVAVPIGTITLDLNTCGVEWRFSDVSRVGGATVEQYDRVAGESDESYTERRLARVRNSDPIGADEIDKFAASCKRIVADVARKGGKVDSIRLAAMMREALCRDELAATRCKSTGGFYFVPNIAARANDNPVKIFGRLAQVCADLNPRNTVALATVTGDAASRHAVGAAARSDIAATLREIEADIASLDDVRKVNQITARADAIKALFDRAAVYRDILDLRLADFDERVESCKAHLRSVRDGLDERRAEQAEARRVRRNERNAERRAESVDDAPTSDTPDMTGLDDASRQIAERMLADGADRMVVEAYIESRRAA